MTAKKAAGDAIASKSSAATVSVALLKNAKAVGQLIEGVRAVADAVRDVAVQRTEQTRIEGETAKDLARIQATRDVLMRYLERSFDERRANFDSLFSRLDEALTQGNVEVVSLTLDAVVKLASTSPFKDLADAATARQALGDKSKEWKF